LKDDTHRELEAGRLRLVSGELSPALLRLLRKHLPEATDNLYLIASIPEQGEDIYDVLVDGRQIIRVEIPRDGVSKFPSVEEMSVERYRQISGGLSRRVRRRLDTAIRLAETRTSVD
jgi:hypothetical protein